MWKMTMRIYGWGAMAVTLAGLVAMLIAPPPSLRTDRDGVAHFTPDVKHPETGEAVSVNTLIRHYRGD